MISHTSEHLEGIIKLVSLSISFYENPISNWARLYIFEFHLVENCDCSIEISESDTSVNKTVVKNFIRFDVSISFHFIEQRKSFFEILRIHDSSRLTLIVYFNSFDECTVSKVVRGYVIIFHFLNKNPSILHFVASYTNINQRIISHIIWFKSTSLHHLKNFKSKV